MVEGTSLASERQEQYQRASEPAQWMEKWPEKIRVGRLLGSGNDPVFRARIYYGDRTWQNAAVKLAVFSSPGSFGGEVKYKALEEPANGNAVREEFERLHPDEPCPIFHYRRFYPDGVPIENKREKNIPHYRGLILMEELGLGTERFDEREGLPIFQKERHSLEEKKEAYDFILVQFLKVLEACEEVEINKVDKPTGDIFYNPIRGQMFVLDWDVVTKRKRLKDPELDKIPKKHFRQDQIKILRETLRNFQLREMIDLFPDDPFFSFVRQERAPILQSIIDEIESRPEEGLSARSSYLKVKREIRIRNDQSQ